MERVYVKASLRGWIGQKSEMVGNVWKQLEVQAFLLLQSWEKLRTA